MRQWNIGPTTKLYFPLEFGLHQENPTVRSEPDSPRRPTATNEQIVQPHSKKLIDIANWRCGCDVALYLGNRVLVIGLGLGGKNTVFVVGLNFRGGSNPILPLFVEIKFEVMGLCFRGGAITAMARPPPSSL